MQSTNRVIRPFVILLTVGLLVTLLIPIATRLTQAGHETAAPVGPVVNGFNGLQDGQVLSGKVVIEAIVAGNNVDRVVFQLDGPQSKRYTDRSAPYFFRGDSNGVPNSWNTTRFPDGDYTMTATATDTAGQSGVLSVRFRIANNAQPQPTSTAAPEPTATAMPALSGPAVTGFKGVQEGQAISGTVGIEAVVVGDSIAQVVFQLDGPRPATHTEHVAPYFFMGDNNGAPKGWDTTQYPNGNYTMTATAADSAGHNGSYIIHFPIVNNVQPQPPSEPTATATAAPPTATTLPQPTATATAAPPTATAPPQPTATATTAAPTATTPPQPTATATAAPPTAPQDPRYPPDSTLTSFSPPTLARPGYLSPIIDPTFGTRITRIADQGVFGMSGRALRHYYAKNQPWNADSSLLLLSYTTPAPLLDGHTYQFLRMVNPPFYPLWSHIDPKKLYGTYAGSSPERNKLVACHIDTCNLQNPSTLTILHDFSADYDYISIGEQEGNLSNDDRYVPLQARKGTNTYMLVYDIPNNQVVATHSFNGLWPDNITISQSGSYVVVDWANSAATSRGVEVYDRNLTFLRQIYPSATHYDLGYDTSGNEVFVGPSFFDPGKLLIARRLDGGGEYVLTDDNPGWRSPGHVSCRNIQRPGWCYMSDDGELTNILGYDEVFAFKIDHSRTVNRFGHLHHTATQICGYDCQPQAVPNPDGTKVLFASDWRAGATAPVYAYIAEMPPR